MFTKKEIKNFYKSQMKICKERIKETINDEKIPQGMKLCIINDLKLAIAQYKLLIEEITKKGKKQWKI